MVEGGGWGLLCNCMRFARWAVAQLLRAMSLICGDSFYSEQHWHLTSDMITRLAARLCW